MNSYDPQPMMDAWRQAMQSYLGYFEAMSSLTTDYLRSMINAVNDPRTMTATPFWAPPPPRSEPAPPPPPPPTPPAQDPTLVIEGEDGKPAFGMFLVENRLPEAVSARVAIDPLLDAAGREVHPEVSFDPETVSLQRGEQALVRVGMLVDPKMEPGVSYRSEVRVPGLSGGRVPVVLRRRPSAVQADATPPRRRTNRRKAAEAASVI
ncbi:MAG: hypothetical protein LUO93_00450 [Methanomicrobiales archaeon]|nr:hypothetical protein [Methanomicrobiales archaeon]